MEQKNNEQKTAQILYITIIMVLLIMALTVGLVTAANRGKTPVVTTDATAENTTTALTVTTKAPVVTTAVTTTKAPTVTTENKPHSVTPPALTTEAKPTVVEPKEPTLPKFIMPTLGAVSKKFSIDTLVYSNTMEDYRTHNGIDISCGTGSAVCAAADGVVKEVYEHPMMGYTVVISHDADAETVYQNLAEELTVAVGDIVKRGEVIGAVGESALIEIAEEPHLHFEMCISGARVNPADYISAETETFFYEE